MSTNRRERLAVPFITAALALTLTGTAPAQEPRGEQFYYPGAFNWTFLETSPRAARLFNAFDYGHAVLYQVLLTKPDRDAAVARLDREYTFLTTDLLRRPPRFAVAEEAVASSYVRWAWSAQAMFHWAHVLHRQLYDIYADARLSDGEKQELTERVTDYYLASPLAFVAVPKSMALMDEQYYSLAFREQHPRFNGLIWAYHWLQVGLYEPLITSGAGGEGPALVEETVSRFFAMVDGASPYPVAMPMTPTVAPEFTRRHPRAAAIFDNLHMMHDIISDILASPAVPREHKRGAIYEALAEFQDPTRNVVSTEEWHAMGEHMGGLAAMGGPPTGVAPSIHPGMPQQHERPTEGHGHGHGGHDE